MLTRKRVFLLLVAFALALLTLTLFNDELRECRQFCSTGKECVYGECEWEGMHDCAGDEDCMFARRGELMCKQAIEDLAGVYSEWTSFEPFNTVVWDDEDEGLIHAIGMDLKIQNEYGVYEDYGYGCTYNLATRDTLDVYLSLLSYQHPD